MNERRKFISSMVAAVPVSVVASQAAQAADNNVKDVVGAWTTTHTSPVGPFRELLVFSDGGGVTETNTLLHTNSRLGLFAQFGLPLPAAVNASDGVRKLLFDEHGVHLGDFRAQGRVRVQDGHIQAVWDSLRIETLSSGAFEVGPATSEGVRVA
jgi:hypothetical protein